jgi:hypothetical protein
MRFLGVVIVELDAEDAEAAMVDFSNSLDPVTPIDAETHSTWWLPAEGGGIFDWESLVHRMAMLAG